MPRSSVHTSRLLTLLLGSPIVLSGACQAPQWQRVEDTSRYVVRRGDRVVAVYQAQANPYKPYVQQLCTPAGIQVLRDSPHDHVHHHALMFALRADEANFWEEHTNPGTEATAATRIDGNTLRSTLAWRDHAGTTLLDERRQIRCTPQSTATRLTWRTALTPAESRGTVVLSGEHYHGLGLRFVTSMDEGASFVHPPGTTSETVRGTERLTTGNWAACTGTVDGHEVTVVMMSHSAHSRPTLWFTMTAPFAYLAATCNGWKVPIPLRHGETLELVFGVALFDGRIDPERIQTCYDQWVAGTPTPGSTDDD